MRLIFQSKSRKISIYSCLWWPLCEETMLECKRALDLKHNSEFHEGELCSWCVFPWAGWNVKWILEIRVLPFSSILPHCSGFLQGERRVSCSWSSWFWPQWCWICLHVQWYSFRLTGHVWGIPCFPLGWMRWDVAGKPVWPRRSRV